MPPPGPDQHYFADPDGNGFDLITVQPGGATWTSKIASAEDAAPALINEALNGYYNNIDAKVTAAPSPLAPGQLEAVGIAPVERAAYGDIMSRTGQTDAQKFETLHKVLGDNPTVIKVGFDTFGPETASRIWGPGSGDPATVNSTERAADSRPSNVIQNSQRQGVGPVPAGGSGGGGGAGGSDGGSAGGSARGKDDHGSPTGSPNAPDTHGQGTASSPRADPKTGGDPLLLASGQLYVQVTDLNVRGRGIHFAFTRTYLHQTLYRGPLGFSWDHCYNLWLREAQEMQPNGFLANVVYRSNGEVREDRFLHVQVAVGGDGSSPDPLSTVPDAEFSGPAGYFDTLSKTEGTYTLRMVNGSVITYNTDLQVDSIRDISGNALTFHYQDRLLVQVVDAVGKIFDFVNDSCGRLVEVLDRTGGRKLAYAYDDIGNMIEVDIFADKDTVTSTDYLYLGMDAPPGTEHNLVEVIGADGNSSLLVTYGIGTEPWSANRVVEQRSADGRYAYEYGIPEYVEDPELGDQLNLPRTLTTVTYPNGHIVEHAFNVQGNVVRRREEIDGLLFGGPQVESLIANYSYNREGMMIREERPDGATVSYLYEVDRYEALNGFGSAEQAPAADRLIFGNLLQRAETARAGTGEIGQILTTWAYLPASSRTESQRGPYYADPTGVELPGQSTPSIRYAYDANERLIRIDYPPAQTADGPTQALPSNHFTYDAHGSLTGATVGAIRSAYEYFPDTLRSGFVRRRMEDADGLARETVYEMDDLGRMLGLRDSLGAQTRWEYNGFDLVTRTIQPEVGPTGARTSPEATVRYDRMRRVKQMIETVVEADGSLHPDGGLIHDFLYDTNGRMTQSTSGTASSPQQRRQRTLYHPWGQPRRMIDDLGVASDLRYESRNLLARVTYAAGTPDQSDQHLRYNRSGELSAVIDALGNETRIERDGFGRVRRVTDRDGCAWETLYDAQDRAIQRRLIGPAPGAAPGDPPVVWSKCLQEFDSAGRLMRRTDVLSVPGDTSIAPRELVTSYYYDEFSRVSEVRDGTLTTHRFVHDGLGRLIESEDADGNRVITHYDDAARRIEVIRAEKELGSAPPRFQLFRTLVLYDDHGLPIEETDTVGNTTRRKHDSRLLVQEISPPGGRTATYRYDLFGQLREQSVSAGSYVILARREYDAGGRLIALVTPNGDRTEWSYDARGRLTAASGPHGPYRYRYDAEGRTIEALSPSGMRVDNIYSPGGRLTAKTVDISGYLPPAGAPGYLPQAVPQVKYWYTPSGHISRVEEGGQTIVFEYDSLGRVLSEKSGPAMPGIVEYAWDDAGRRASFTYPGGRSVRYTHSPAGYLTAVEQTAAGAGYPGDPMSPAARTLLEIGRIGSRPSWARAPGILQADYSYDAARRLVGIDYTHGADAIDRLRVLHGAGGERLLDECATGLRAFDYDPLRRLQSARDLSASALSVTALAPAADEPGLATVVKQPSIDALAQSTIASAAAAVKRSFDYDLDASGNRLATSTVLTPAGPVRTTAYLPGPGDHYEQVDGLATLYDLDGNLLSDGVRSFRYDVLGRLRQAIGGGIATDAQYDPLGRLADLASGGVVLHCRWAGLALVEVEQGAMRTQLVPGDRILSQAHLATDGREIVPLVDDVGSVIGWAGTGGITLGTREYDPFGRPLAKSGLDPAPLGFAGYLLAPLTELYWLAARIYDSKLGRFLQPDPMGFVDGMNVYAFARNAPGMFIDTLGFKSNELDWGTVAWNATKTAAVGVVIVGGAAALVAGGVVSAPFVLTVGGLAMVGVAMNSFFNRSDEAFKAGQTDPAGKAALAALGEPFGITNIVEGATGNDAVTDRVLGSQERSERLGTGIGTAGTVLLGPKAARIGGRIGTPSNPMSLYSVPSISRPTYYNPLVTGKYVSPQGVVWEGNVFKGGYQATVESWRAQQSGDDFFGSWHENFRAPRSGSGNYWHTRSHFADMPGRDGAHSFFDPALREHMILLGDAPLIAQQGGTAQIGNFSVGPEQAFPLREVWPNASARGSDAAYNSVYAFVGEPYPRIGKMGGNPRASHIAGIHDQMPPAPPPGSPLNGGYRVILRDGGQVGVVSITTMYPE